MANSILENFKKESKNGSKLTVIIISLLVFVSLVALTIVIVMNSYEQKASRLYEKVLFELNEFDSMPNIESKMLLEDDIMKVIDPVIVRYPLSTSAKKALFYKAYVYYNINKFDDSIVYFEQFINKNKNHYLIPKANFFLALAYNNKGDISKAIEILKGFNTENTPVYFKPIALFTLGNIYENNNEIDKAIECYDIIINDFKDSSQYNPAFQRKIIIENNIELFLD